MVLIRDALIHRIHPKELIRISLPRDPDAATQQAVSLLKSHREEGSKSLEWQNYFGRWQQIDDQQAERHISEHITSLLDRIDLRRTSDIVRKLSPITLAINRGLPSVGFVGRWVAPFDWLLSISAIEFTQLGDGVAVWSRDDGWGFTQRKGNKNFHSKFLIRQRR